MRRWVLSVALAMATLVSCSSDPVDLEEPVDVVEEPSVPQTVPTADTAPTTPPDPRGPALVFEGPPPRNLLMISIDTLRRDHVAPYAEGEGDMPFLSGLMATGVPLHDFQQCSNWTFHSTSCTLQGQYSEDFGYVPAIANGVVELEGEQQSFAVRLAVHGYGTAIAWANGFVSPRANNAQGYQTLLSPGLETLGAATLAEAGRSHLLDHVKTKAGAPWFLHLHFMEPHVPYVAPDSYYDELGGLPKVPEWIADLFDASGGLQANHYFFVNSRIDDLGPKDRALAEAYLKLRYRADVRWLDDQIAEWWANYEADGLLDDTLVVFWSDHGEQFWERGRQTHAYFLGAEENDAIALFWAKNLIPREIDHPTHAVDLLPTVLDALDVPFDADDPSLSGRVVDDSLPASIRYSSSRGRIETVQAVTSPSGFKLMYLPALGSVRLFDRGTDREETVDLYSADHPEVGPLWEALAPRAVQLGGVTGVPPVAPPGLTFD